MIKIEGKGKTNWTRDDGKVIDWTNYVVKYKNDRVRPSFISPEPVREVWNGKETDVQHVRYDGRAIEITAKESETDFMSYLESLDEMIITDFEQNESGTVINQIDTVDLTKSDNFEIEAQENLAQTSGASYIIKFRTNRTVINKALPVLNTNNIEITTDAGTYTYYSDYDVLDYSRIVEDIKVPWPDGSEKLAVSISKTGYEYLQYVETEDYDTFIERLKAANTVEINSVEVTELEIEPTSIAEGLWRIVIRGISSVDRKVHDLAPDDTYNINMNSGAIIYYSDYAVYTRSRDVQKVEVEWDDGSTKTLQTIKKQTYEFVYFTDDPEDIITNVNSYNDVKYSSSTLTEIETSQEEIALNLFKVTISGVYNLDVDTIYTFPTSGGTFAITDETPTTYTYYTDYTSEVISVEAAKNTINNQDGINITTKSITKTTLRLRFYIGQTNAFGIKKYCELFKPGWTCTWNSGTVYEILNSDNIAPTLLEGSPLTSAIYEVIVDILTDTTTN